VKVKDIMTENVVYAEVPGNSSEALELLLKHNISGIPVVKRGTKELMGIVTRSDFARNPEEGQLALLMTREVHTTTPEEDIKNVARAFLEKNFRRMPVVTDSHLVGIVTVSDIVWRAIAKMNISEPVEKYMESKITTVWEETPLKVAYEIMRLSGERALPVLDNEGKMSGIIGDTDLLKVFEITESTHKSELSGGTEGDRWGWDSKNVIYITKKRLELPDKRVKDVMVKDVVTVTKRTSVSECAKRMAKKRIEQIPVINAEGDLIGMVKDISLLKAMF
jgi:CBS domain-containing protein